MPLHVRQGEERDRYARPRDRDQGIRDLGKQRRGLCVHGYGYAGAKEARNGDCHRARGEEVSEGERNLRQRIQEQTVRSARDFYGDSLGRLKDRLQGDRAQLEDLAEQLPEGDAQAQIRDMVDSYSKIESRAPWGRWPVRPGRSPRTHKRPLVRPWIRSGRSPRISQAANS